MSKRWRNSQDGTATQRHEPVFRLRREKAQAEAGRKVGDRAGRCARRRLAGFIGKVRHPGPGRDGGADPSRRAARHHTRHARHCARHAARREARHRASRNSVPGDASNIAGVRRRPIPACAGKRTCWGGLKARPNAGDTGKTSGKGACRGRFETRPYAGGPGKTSRKGACRGRFETRPYTRDTGRTTSGNRIRRADSL